jgi:hypothetical protein
MTLLCLVALAALAGTFRLPKVLDIYISDRRYVVSRRSIIIFILLLIVAPLLVVTIRQGQTALR